MLVLVPPASDFGVSLGVQPANVPRRPNSAIRANNLFIVRVTFTKSVKRTSKMLWVSNISFINIREIWTERLWALS